MKTVEIFFDDYFARPSAKNEIERACDDEDDHYKVKDGGSTSGDSEDSEDATIAIAHHGSNVDHWQEPPSLISPFQAQNRRFSQDVKAIWDILAESPKDLQVTDITFFLDGHSTYRFFGSDFCMKSLKLDAWQFQECELWPAIVTCKVATFLPALEVLDIRGLDNELRWPRMRNHLRQGKSMI